MPITQSIGVAVQSFAMFVALSVVFGRIYFLSYHKTLGIPVSETPLGIAEYSVISPDAAIVSIGFVVISAATLVMSSNFSAKWRVGRVVAGIGFGSIAILFCWFYEDLFARGDSPLPVGMRGSWNLLCMFLSMVAGFLIVSGFPSIVSVLQSNADAGVESEISKDSREYRSFGYMLIGALIVILLLFASSLVVVTARQDARNHLREAPPAYVDFPPSAFFSTIIRQDPSICSDGARGCKLRVVLMGEKFAYFTRWDCNSIGEHELYSFPTASIAAVHYVPNQPMTCG